MSDLALTEYGKWLFSADELSEHLVAEFQGRNEQDDDSRFLELCAKERKRIKRRRAKGLDDYTDREAALIRKNEADNRSSDRYWSYDEHLLLPDWIDPHFG